MLAAVSVGSTTVPNWNRLSSLLYYRTKSHPSVAVVVKYPSTCSVGDLDNDGRLDAVVVTNDAPTKNHWLILELVGHKSNRDAIGAEVRVTTPDLQQMATVSTGGSYLSSSDKRVHFGLGQNLKAQKIEIRWPSGITQILTDVPVDKFIKIDESR